MCERGMAMEQKLKMRTSRAVVLASLLLVVLVLDVYLIYEFIVNYIFFSDFDVFDFNFVTCVVAIATGLFVELYGIILIYNSTVKALTFDDKRFTYKGKTYGYHKIENVKIIGGRFEKVSYKICVDGKNLYIFDNEYEGATDFLTCLNFHKVAGTPRG